MMKATDFEFSNRWWIFALIFGACFAQFSYDHTPVGARILPVLTSRFGWTENFGAHVVFGAAAALMVFAALVRTWGSSYLGRDIVHDSALRNEKLRADGPYRHTRNPLYLGNVLMAFAMVAMAPLGGVPIILIGVPLFCYRLIGREEAGLEASLGDSYREYMRAVPRLFPSLRARIPAGGAKPDLLNGLAAEAFFWSFAAGLIAFSILLNATWFFAGFALSPVFSWLAGLALKGRTAAA